MHGVEDQSAFLAKYKSLSRSSLKRALLVNQSLVMQNFKYPASHQSSNLDLQKTVRDAMKVTTIAPKCVMMVSASVDVIDDQPWEEFATKRSPGNSRALESAKMHMPNRT